MPLVCAVQLVPDAVGVSTGWSALHDVVLQPPVGSIGRSVGSATFILLPLPSHWICLQSPLTCSDAGRTTPGDETAVPHTPPMHAATRHGFLGAGQSVASIHDMGTTTTLMPSTVARSSVATGARSSDTDISGGALVDLGPLPTCQQVLSAAHQ
jgi:hypothetical protein